MARPKGCIEKVRKAYRVRLGKGEVTQRSRSLASFEEAEELLDLIREELPSDPEPVTHHPLYRTWQGMLNRCRNPNNPAFKYYGGRGIAVCQRWRDSFEDFVSDVGERPEGMTLDREDTDGDYDPDNCRWADSNTQAKNRRELTVGDTGYRNIYMNNTGYSVVVTRNGVRMGKTHRELKDAISERDSILEEVS